MKNKWSNYALKDGKVQSSYIREYSSRSPKREARKTSCRNSLFESGEKQAQEEVELVYRESVAPVPEKIKKILEDSWVINLSGSAVDVQDVSGKQAGRKRKARDSDNGSQEQNKKG